MSRKPCLFVPACVYHVMPRGIDGRDIFCDALLGDHDFVKSAIEKDRYRRAEMASHAAKGWNLDRLGNYIAGKVDVSTVELKKRGRATSGSRARKLMAYLGYAKLGISQHEIAVYLNVTGSAVPQKAVSGEKIARATEMDKLII